jgi:TRAP-type transport system periplasmic protein
MRKAALGLLLASATALSCVSAKAENLMLGTGNIPIHPLNVRVIVPWAERVNAQANGALEIVVRHGQMLVNNDNFVDRVTDDVVQMAFGMMVFQPGRFPRSLISTVPFVEGSAEAGAIAFCSLYEAGAFSQELEGLVPLFFVGFPQSSVHVNGGELNTMADINGRKIMVGSPTAAAVVTEFGGTPLSIPIYDHYQSFQRGTADGNFMTFTAFPAFNLHEVTTSHLSVPLGGATGMLFMSKERWDALSPEARAVLEANSGCDVTREVGAEMDRWENEARNFVASQEGHTVTTIKPEELTQLQGAVAEKVFEGFRGRVEGGDELLNQWKAAMIEARKQTGESQ